METTAAAARLEWLFLAAALWSPSLLMTTRDWFVPARIAAPSRAARHIVYFAAAAATIAALLWLGCAIDPSRALLRGRIAAFGSSATAAYVVVWMCGWWPSAGSGMPTRAGEGVLLGLFAAAMLGVELGAYSAAVLTLAGLIFGAVRTSRLRLADV